MIKWLWSLSSGTVVTRVFIVHVPMKVPRRTIDSKSETGYLEIIHNPAMDSFSKSSIHRPDQNGIPSLPFFSRVFLSKFWKLGSPHGKLDWYWAPDEHSWSFSFLAAAVRWRKALHLHGSELSRCFWLQILKKAIPINLNY